jgi:hypothetical protein
MRERNLTNNPMNNPESRKKISLKQKGVKRVLTPELRKRYSESMRLRNLTSNNPMKNPESRKKLSLVKRERFKKMREQGKQHPFKGKTFEERLGHLQSIIARKKLSLSLKGKNVGEKNGNWRGGFCEPYGREFNRKLKEQICCRDSRQCQLCKKEVSGRKKDIHHIDYNKKNNNPFNLILLCVPCHGKTNGNREYWTNFLEQYQFGRGLKNEMMEKIEDVNRIN